MSDLTDVSLFLVYLKSFIIEFSIWKQKGLKIDSLNYLDSSNQVYNKHIYGFSNEKQILFWLKFMEEDLEGYFLSFFKHGFLLHLRRPNITFTHIKSANKILMTNIIKVILIFALPNFNKKKFCVGKMKILGNVPILPKVRRVEFVNMYIFFFVWFFSRYIG